MCLALPPRFVVGLRGWDIEANPPAVCLPYEECIGNLAERPEGREYVISSEAILQVLRQFFVPYCPRNGYRHVPNTDPNWLGPVVYTWYTLQKLNALAALRRTCTVVVAGKPAAKGASATVPGETPAPRKIDGISREDVLAVFYPPPDTASTVSDGAGIPLKCRCQPVPTGGRRKAYMHREAFRSLVNLGIPILETDFVLCWMTDELRNGAAETDSEIGADDLGDGRVEE